MNQTDNFLIYLERCKMSNLQNMREVLWYHIRNNTNDLDRSITKLKYVAVCHRIKDNGINAKEKV